MAVSLQKLLKMRKICRGVRRFPPYVQVISFADIVCFTPLFYHQLLYPASPCIQRR
jgi:hypothetical protein